MNEEAVERVREELQLLRASLLDDELVFEGATEQQLSEWIEPATSQPTTSPPSLTIKLGADVLLTASYEPPTGRPACALVSSSATSAAPPSVLVEALEEGLKEADEAFPVWTVYNTLRDLALELPVKATETAAPPTARVATTETEGPKRYKLAMLWAHHLLATSKRKDLLAWSNELSLVGGHRVGYPGMIVCCGEAEVVDDFEARVRRLQWYALQVRLDEELPDSDAQRVRSTLGGWHETESVGEMTALMRDAQLDDVFLTAMKIGH